MASGSGQLPVKVTNDYVAQAAAACKNTADTVRGELESLKTYIENMEAYWQGIAFKTFQDLMTEYSTFSEMLYNALTDIGSGLEGNFVNYHDSEQANIKTITAIQETLSTVHFS